MNPIYRRIRIISAGSGFTNQNASRDGAFLWNEFSLQLLKIWVGLVGHVINFARFQVIGQCSGQDTVHIQYLTSLSSVHWCNDCIAAAVAFNVWPGRDRVIRLTYKSIYVVGNARAICSEPNCCKRRPMGTLGWKGARSIRPAPRPFPPQVATWNGSIRYIWL